jgi:hypothetical protein
MNLDQQAKVKRFINDTLMSDTIREIIEKTFLMPSGSKDVQYLAAERLALDFLQEAWREFEKYKDSVGEKENKIQDNVGM